MFSLQEIVNPHIWRLKAYSSARNEYIGNEGLFFDANENPYGHYNRYPDPLQKELKAIIGSLKGIKPTNLALGNGSDEIIDIALRIFCSQEVSKALICSPTYGMYQVAADIQNVKILDIPLKSDFQLDIDLLQEAIKDKSLHLIFLCSPNNPTGNLLRKSDIKYVLNNFNGIILLDEAYIDFSIGNSLVSWIDEYPNLMVMQTLSKAWGLAALRLGILCASEEIIALYNKVKPPYNISQAAQEAALKILSQSESHSRDLEQILTEKEKLIVALGQLNGVKKIYPSDANFLLVEVEDADCCYHQLLKNGIIVRNRHSQVKNTLRITVGKPVENQLLIEAFKTIC